MLNLSLKQTIAAMMIILALLVVLAGGILRSEAMRNAPGGLPGPHSSGWYCPPPPVDC